MRRWIAAVVTGLLLTAGALAAQPEPAPTVPAAPTPDAATSAFIQAQAAVSAFTVQTERNLAELDERIAAANQAVDYAFNLLNLFQVLGGILALVGVVGVVGALQTWWRLQATTNRVEREIRHAIDERRREMRELAIASATITSLLDLAERQYRGGDVKGAITVLKSAAEQDRQIARQVTGDEKAVGYNPRVHYLLGYYLENDTQKKDAQGQDRSEEDKEKQYKQALESLDRALAIDADYHPALAAKGLVLRRLAKTAPEAEQDGQYDESARLLRAALANGYEKLIDEDGESWYGSLGGLYNELGEHRRAIRYYERAASIVKNASYPLVNLALLLLKHGRADQKATAEAYFKDAIEIVARRRITTPKNLYLFSDLIIASAAVDNEVLLQDAITQYIKLGGDPADPIRRLTQLGEVLPIRLPVVGIALKLLNDPPRSSP